MKKNKNNQKLSSRTVFQSLFMSSDLFVANSLSQSATSCAFGFLFSLLPVILLILIVVTRILHTNQDILVDFYPYISNFITLEQYESISNALIEIRQIGIFEVITVLAIFWISRRFFVTVMKVFHKIFRNQTKRKNFLFTISGILGEVILIVGLGIISSIIIAVAPILRTSRVLSLFPEAKAEFLHFLVTFGPYILLFVAVLLTYKFAPGTKPKLKLCLCSSLCCVAIFFIVQKILRIFLNISRYNLIYGVLSNIIILLLEVNIFFQIFLFFAQYIYVSQFFDILLLGELYLLPKRESPRLFLRLRRFLFIKPAKLVNIENNVIHLKKGEQLYEVGNQESDVFYIASGYAEIVKNNHIEYANPGSFIGEVSAFLDIPREATVIAQTDLQLVKIKEEDFQTLLQTNPKVTQRLLENVAKVKLN